MKLKCPQMYETGTFSQINEFIMEWIEIRFLSSKTKLIKDFQGRGSLVVLEM